MFLQVSVCPQGGVPAPGGVWSGGAWWRPPGRLLLRAVRILLECILVTEFICYEDDVISKFYFFMKRFCHGMNTTTPTPTTTPTTTPPTTTTPTTTPTTPPPPPPPPPPTTPAPPQSLSDCPNCICTNIWLVYGSPQPGQKYCCSRSNSPELHVQFYVLWEVLNCPDLCYADCGNSFHCCTGAPRTTTTTTTTTPPPPPPSGGGGGCFPSSGNVLLENGKSVTISELHLGDHVQTGKAFHFKVICNCVIVLILKTSYICCISIQYHQLVLSHIVK